MRALRLWAAPLVAMASFSAQRWGDPTRLPASKGASGRVGWLLPAALWQRC